MAQQKIDRVKLNQLLKQGKSQKEIAQVFEVSEAAISKAKKELKELNVSVVKNVALENAHKVVASHLDTVSQMQKINQAANELLDMLMRWGRGDEEALQILEGQVRKVKVRGIEEEVKEYRFKDPRELALRAMAEIRAQLALQWEMMKTLFDVEAVSEFQQEVLGVIGEVSVDVRNRIVERLKAKGALRGAVSIN